ncbi:MAG TPA: cupin domain-containing protein [Sediminibacterium sp.]|nr:cupin domain-containing protein [Sediminibacterium sp.]
MQKLSADIVPHYQWGNQCDGWILKEDPDLSIKQERMPPGTAEQWHYHEKARQFFYMLQGVAMMDIGDETIPLLPEESIEILPGTAHRIRNVSGVPVVFLLVTQPSAAQDRINITV